MDSTIIHDSCKVALTMRSLALICGICYIGIFCSALAATLHGEQRGLFSDG